jgi:hypothetical protein
MQSLNDAINNNRISGGERSILSHADDVFARVDTELKYEIAKLTKYIEYTTPRLEDGKQVDVCDIIDECDNAVEYAIDECDAVHKCIDIRDIFETWNMDNVEGDSYSDEELLQSALHDLGDEVPNWNSL